MTVDGWVVLAVVIGCFLVLVVTSISADIVFFGGLGLVIALNIVPVEEALIGFSNEGMLTVAALYVVSAGLKETGAIQRALQRIIGVSNNIRRIQTRLMVPVIFVSAFINNTPVVASIMPALENWSRKNRIPVSKLLIPLSYAAILGGTCTLIGTSTNLVVNGLLLAEENTRGISLFELAYVGIPCAIVGFLYMIVVGQKLLPNRGWGFDTFKESREYTTEMIVEKGALGGKTLGEAGIYDSHGLYLLDIYRGEDIIPVSSSQQQLVEGDRLIFVGTLDSIIDMQQIKGLQPAADQLFKLDTPRRDRLLIEAVISPSHPANYQTIKEVRFRNLYDAVVLAVARNGERIKQKVGDISLRAGDTLLLEAAPSFWNRNKNSSEYYLISPIVGYSNPATEKSGVAWSVLIGMVGLVTSGILSMFEASLLAAGAMIVTGCCGPQVAKDNIDWGVLIVIASSIGLGNTLEITGTAKSLATAILEFASDNPEWVLVATYLATTLLTEIINNNSAAVLIFPIAMSLANSLGLNYLPFAITIMMAASASFATPIGYQTNLMIYGPGQYKFTDFTRVGAPLNLLLGVVTVLIVPYVWPLK